MSTTCSSSSGTTLMQWIGGEAGDRAVAVESVQRWIARWEANDVGQFAVVLVGRVIGRVGFKGPPTLSRRADTVFPAMPGPSGDSPTVTERCLLRAMPGPSGDSPTVTERCRLHADFVRTDRPTGRTRAVLVAVT
jgi:hypothetical protein